MIDSTDSIIKRNPLRRQNKLILFSIITCVRLHGRYIFIYLTPYQYQNTKTFNNKKNAMILAPRIAHKMSKSPSIPKSKHFSYSFFLYIYLFVYNFLS